MALAKNTNQPLNWITQTEPRLVALINCYSQTFLLLHRYDAGLLPEILGTMGGVIPSLAEVRQSIANLKINLMSRSEASDLFGIEQGDTLAAFLGSLEQSVSRLSNH